MAYRFGHTVRLGCRLTDGKRGYACTRSQNLLRLVNAEAAADVCKKEQTNASAGCCSFHRRIPGGGFCSVTIRAQLQRTMLAEKLYLSRNDACMHAPRYAGQHVKRISRSHSFSSDHAPSGALQILISPCSRVGKRCPRIAHR